ncbi:MAG: phosphopantothenoylcysteine decarboxylase [Deltaproteobacteria bacterium]|nr:phosphopantothenoylcysteine decarboxylase [Deltaproteobacteria bacterium]
MTGSIAAYKSCSLVSALLGEKAEVRVMATDAALRFVTSMTFQALCGSPVYSDIWHSHHPDEIEHISVPHWADLIVIAPATANTLAKIAHGFADNFLTAAVLAAKPETPVFLAPAMNTYMWQNPITQRKLASLLQDDTYHLIKPREGMLACGDVGVGKMADVSDIIEAMKRQVKSC